MKLEDSTVIQFEFKSRMKGVGLYKQAFTLKRITDSHRIMLHKVKSELTGGVQPLTRTEGEYFNVLAHLSVLCEPVTPQGKAKDPNWLENMHDPALKIELFKKLMEYQDSFYEADDEASEVS